MRAHDRMYATPAQEAYIKALRNECFGKLIHPEYGPTTRKQLRSAASAEIEMLRRVLGKSTEASQS